MATFSGDNGNNTLVVVPGSNTYDGLGGIDTLDFTPTTFQQAAATKTGPFSGTVRVGGDVNTFLNVENLAFFDGRLTFDTADQSAQAFRLYNTAFMRAPDQAGFEMWSDALRGGLTLTQEANLFLNTPEGQAHFGGLDDAGFVSTMYQQALGRAGSPDEISGWVAQLSLPGVTRGDVLVGFSESAEHIGRTAASIQAGLWDNDRTVEDIAAAYHTGLGRAPDRAGAIAWDLFLGISHHDLRDLANGIAASPEFQSHHAGQDNAQFVTALYQDGLGRTPSADEANGWISLLNSGTSRADVLHDFLNSPETLVHAYNISAHGIIFA